MVDGLPWVQIVAGVWVIEWTEKHRENDQKIAGLKLKFMEVIN